VSHLFSAALAGSSLCTQNLLVNTNSEAVELSVFQGLNLVIFFRLPNQRRLIHINKMFVGIDVAKDSLVACAMDDQGEDVFPSYSVENNRPGCLKLINLIADNANLLKPDIIKVGMEATNVFWEHCYRLIKNHEKLNSNYIQSILR
jgi:hypothetical protein